jgi:hypothetical protein
MHEDRVTPRRASVSKKSWSGGRLLAPDRLLVLLACGATEADRLRHAWVGQAIDVESSSDLATALVRTGQLGPSMVVIGDGDGVSGPSISYVPCVRPTPERR